MEEENLLTEIRDKGAYFKSKLLALKQEYMFVVDVRGEGLMLGMQLDFPCREIVNRCLEAGFVINVTSENVLRFLPPYIISKKEISRFIKALDKIFSEVAQSQVALSPAEHAVAGDR